MNLFNMLIKVHIHQNTLMHKPDNVPTHSGISVCFYLVLSEKFSKGRSKFYLDKTPQLVTKMSFKFPFHLLSKDGIGLVAVGLRVSGLLGFLEGGNTVFYALMMLFLCSPCSTWKMVEGGGTGTCTGQDA